MITQIMMYTHNMKTAMLMMKMSLVKNLIIVHLCLTWVWSGLTTSLVLKECKGRGKYDLRNAVGGEI